MLKLQFYFKKKKLRSRIFFRAQKNPSLNKKDFIFGWKTGFEPATLGTTNRYSNQLSYNHHIIAGANIIIFSTLIKEIFKLIYLNFLRPRNVLW